MHDIHTRHQSFHWKLHFTTVTAISSHWSHTSLFIMPLSDAFKEALGSPPFAFPSLAQGGRWSVPEQLLIEGEQLIDAALSRSHISLTDAALNYMPLLNRMHELDELSFLWKCLGVLICAYRAHTSDETDMFVKEVKRLNNTKTKWHRLKLGTDALALLLTLRPDLFIRYMERDLPPFRWSWLGRDKIKREWPRSIEKLSAIVQAAVDSPKQLDRAQFTELARQAVGDEMEDDDPVKLEPTDEPTIADEYAARLHQLEVREADFERRKQEWEAAHPPKRERQTERKSERKEPDLPHRTPEQLERIVSHQSVQLDKLSTVIRSQKDRYRNLQRADKQQVVQGLLDRITELESNRIGPWALTSFFPDDGGAVCREERAFTADLDWWSEHNASEQIHSVAVQALRCENLARERLRTEPGDYTTDTIRFLEAKAFYMMARDYVWQIHDLCEQDEQEHGLELSTFILQSLNAKLDVLDRVVPGSTEDAEEEVDEKTADPPNRRKMQVIRYLGKANAVPTLRRIQLAHFPDTWLVYSPFAGGMNFELDCLRRLMDIHANDIDPRIMGFWRQVRANRREVIEAAEHHMELMTNKQVYLKALDRLRFGVDRADQAGQYWVARWRSRRGLGSGGFAPQDINQSPEQARQCRPAERMGVSNCPDLDRVDLTCGDYEQFLSAVPTDNPGLMLFLDPPYLNEHHMTGAYGLSGEYDRWDEAKHLRLRELLRPHPRWMLCHSAQPAIRKMYAGHTIVDGYSFRQRKEIVVLSTPGRDEAGVESDEEKGEAEVESEQVELEEEKAERVESEQSDEEKAEQVELDDFVEDDESDQEADYEP